MSKMTTADDDAPRPRPVGRISDLLRRAHAGDADAQRAVIAILSKTEGGRRLGYGKRNVVHVWGGRLTKEDDE